MTRNQKIVEQESKSCKLAAQEKWSGLRISQVYLGALTESNFHDLRQILEPILLHYFEAKQGEYLEDI